MPAGGPAAGRSETGKLYPEQGQIGGRNPVRRGRGALPSPRVGRTSRRVTGGPRWMTVARFAEAAGHRTRLTDRLADAPTRSDAASGRVAPHPGPCRSL